MVKRKLHILVIDDDLNFLDLLKIYFTRHKESLKINTHGEAKVALRKIRKIRPDMIICDYQMPDVTGIEVRNILTERNFNIPFVLCTASTKEELLKIVELNQVDHFIEKKGSFEATFKEIYSLIKHTFDLNLY